MLITPIRYSEITDAFYVKCPTCQGEHGFHPDLNQAMAIHPTVFRAFNFGDNNYQQNYFCPIKGGPLFKVTFRWQNGGFGVGHYAVEMLPEMLVLPDILPELPPEMLLEMLPKTQPIIMIYGYRKWGDDEDPPKLGWIHLSAETGDLMSSKPILIYPHKIVDHMGWETVTCGKTQTQPMWIYGPKMTSILAYCVVQRTGYLSSKVIFRGKTYGECEEYLKAYFLKNPGMVTVRERFDIRPL